VTDVTIVCSVCCPSVTLLQPAKAIGRNEMPFGRDICVVPSNIVYLVVKTPSQNLRCNLRCSLVWFVGIFSPEYLLFVQNVQLNCLFCACLYLSIYSVCVYACVCACVCIEVNSNIVSNVL